MSSIDDVTIIIPSYCPTEQHVKWLAEAIHSALQQECKVIVIDDGSQMKDEVRQVLYAVKDNLDEALMLTEHRGVSAVRNTAAMMVKTPLLYPLDGDDILADGALKQLTSMWNGTPIYSDLIKFDNSKSVQYPLLDFDCDLIRQKVGLASVNVLHSVEQHKFIGGWDTGLDFYEDGEYNARLMICFGGVRFPKPLVGYRQHEHQRTKQYRMQHDKYKNIVFDKIRRFDMPCPGGCGGKKKNSTQTGVQAMSQMSRQTAAATLPGEDGEGRVLVQYVGGQGRGGHYYRGPKTNYAYKVKHGEYYHVDPKDAIEPNQNVSINTSLFVKVYAETPKVEKKTEIKKDKKERKPRVDKDKEPVLAIEVNESEDDDLYPIHVEPQHKVLRALDDINPEDAEELLEIEEGTRNRVKVVAKLKKIIKSLE